MGVGSTPATSNKVATTLPMRSLFQPFAKAFRGLLGNGGCLSSWDLMRIIAMVGGGTGLVRCHVLLPYYGMQGGPRALELCEFNSVIWELGLGAGGRRARVTSIMGVFLSPLPHNEHMLKVRWRHESAFASDRFTSHELLPSVILAFKDMHFSYNLAPKHKPVTSSGAQPEKQPLWVILAEHDCSCSLWRQLFARTRLQCHVA